MLVQVQLAARQKGNPEGFPFCIDGATKGLESERKAKPPAEGLQRRRPEPDFREAKASPVGRNGKGSIERLSLFCCSGFRALARKGSRNILVGFFTLFPDF